MKAVRVSWIDLHEAAHCVAALAMGGYVGLTFSDWDGGRATASIENDPFKEMVILAAGDVTSGRILPFSAVPLSPSDSVIVSDNAVVKPVATELACEIVRQELAGIREVVTDADQAEALVREMVAAGRIKPRNAIRWWRRASYVAQRVIDRHANAVRWVALGLATRGALTGDEIRQLFLRGKGRGGVGRHATPQSFYSELAAAQ